MWTKPDALFVAVLTADSLPVKDGPVQWHPIFRLVATKGDSELWIIAVLDSPISDLMPNREVIFGVQPFLTS